MKRFREHNAAVLLAVVAIAVGAFVLALAPQRPAYAGVPVLGDVTATAGSGGVIADRFVKLSAAGTIITATAATDSVIGVAELTADANELTCYSPAPQRANVLSGAAIAVGELVTATTAGKAIPVDATTATAQRYAGVALTAATDANQSVSILQTAGVVSHYSAAVPIVIGQGYTQTLLEDTDAVDVTGSLVTVADLAFAEGYTLHYVLGGTVVGANGTISVSLYFEDATVMTLTTANGAAGDWIAEFTVVGVSGTAQRIVGSLIAEAGAELKCDYAADTTTIAAAGTIPVKCIIDLGDAADAISVEYVRVERWTKTD